MTHDILLIVKSLHIFLWRIVSFNSMILLSRFCNLVTLSGMTGHVLGLMEKKIYHCLTY